MFDPSDIRYGLFSHNRIGEPLVKQSLNIIINFMENLQEGSIINEFSRENKLIFTTDLKFYQKKNINNNTFSKALKINIFFSVRLILLKKMKIR